MLDFSKNEWDEATARIEGERLAEEIKDKRRVLGMENQGLGLRAVRQPS